MMIEVSNPVAAPFQATTLAGAVPAETSASPAAQNIRAPLDIAQAYMARHWAPIPIPHGKKNPQLENWPDLRLTEEQLPEYFNGRPQNIGILLGTPSKGLTDVDIDAPEALAIADYFLPVTGAVFGRKSCPRSHRLYTLEADLKTATFKDPDGTMLVELRSTGLQTVFPPSRHPSGEDICWENDGEPARIAAEELRRAVLRLAAASLIARHWPHEGSRQDAALALVGALCNLGWDSGQVLRFVKAVVYAAKDEEGPERLKAVEYTFRAFEERRPITGWPRLAKLISEPVASRAYEWLSSSLERTTETTEARKDAAFHAWTAEAFLKRELPAKEPLIEGLLYRRDMVAFAGRRRHGKTNFILNLATALAQGLPSFLGYVIPERRNVLVFFLEDDTREIQEKLGRVLDAGHTDGRLTLMVREDFFQAGITIDLDNDGFRKTIETACQTNQPDLVIFDNLAQMISADYNNPKRVHDLASFAYGLTAKTDAAIIVAAHPRKRPNDKQAPNCSLKDNSEGFFEDVMGSSHFVNSFGSLWGLERNLETERTVFLGGTQRLTGQQSIATLEMAENGRLEVVSDFAENLSHAMNTPKRSQAWQQLPEGPFTYLEAYNAVKHIIRSQSTFNEWWRNSLLRLNLVKPQGDRYLKASGQKSSM